MHYSIKTLAACLAVAGTALSQTESPSSESESQSASQPQMTGPISIESVSGCAAVVSTTDICSTCMTIDCVELATVTAGCGECPTTAPTIFRSHGCDQGCEGLTGCATKYTVVTVSGEECSATPTPTLSESISALTTTSVSTAGGRRLSPLRLW